MRKAPITPLFWRMRDNSGPWMVSVGTLDNAQGLTIKEHIYYDKKADFYDFADHALRLTGVDFIVRTFTMLGKMHGKDFLAAALPQLKATFDEETVAEVRRLLVENGTLSAEETDEF